MGFLVTCRKAPVGVARPCQRPSQMARQRTAAATPLGWLNRRRRTSRLRQASSRAMAGVQSYKYKCHSSISISISIAITISSRILLPNKWVHQTASYASISMIFNDYNYFYVFSTIFINYYWLMFLLISKKTMLLNAFQWFPMIINYSHWFSLFSNDSQFFLYILYDFIEFQWLSMILNKLI